MYWFFGCLFTLLAAACFGGWLADMRRVDVLAIATCAALFAALVAWEAGMISEDE